MPTQHAKLSASGSSRWLNCPGSVRLEQSYPDSTSTFAEEGTAAHALAEHCLNTGTYADDHVGDNCPDTGLMWTEEMAAYVQQYVDYCRDLPGHMFVEERVDFSLWVPEGFGTSDCIVISECGTEITVVDLKYGKGVRVDADNNTQGMLYGLGTLSDLSFIYPDIERINLVIHQPRLDHVSEWSLTTDELLEWAKWVSKQAKLCLSDDAPLVPGEKQCQWCKAKADCKALYNHTAKVIGAEFDDLDQVDEPQTLTPEQLALVLANKSLIESWLKAVSDRSLERMLSGEKIEGFKLVEGRSNRKWKDESEASELLAAELGDDAFTKKLLTPAQAEKKLGKPKAKAVNLVDRIIKPEGATTIAPVSDKRREIQPTSDDFEDLS